MWPPATPEPGSIMWLPAFGGCSPASPGVSRSGLSRVIERVFDPTIQVVRNIPVTAWVPLSLVFFGIGNAPAVFLIGLGTFFPAAVNTTHGVRQVNATLTKAARIW